MDEFNKDIDEFYDSTKEFKPIEAIEYYPSKESAKAPEELLQFSEDNSDNENKDDDAVSVSEKPDLDDLRQKVRNLNSDGTHATQPQGIEAVETAGSTTAATTTATVVSSSATLAGVSILAVAAAAIVGTNVLNDPPVLKNENMTLGCDYCLYEFDIDQSSLYKDATYRIELTDGIDKFVNYIDKDMEHQRLLFTGLKPNWSYKYRVVAKYGSIENYYYNEKFVRTDNPKSPVAIFEFTPQITLEEDGTNRYNLDYNIYISNKYGDISQSYVTIRYGNNHESNDDINKNNFIKGCLYNLRENTEIEFSAYSFYSDEIVQIGYESFNVKYPDDFVSVDEVFNSTYVFNEDSISNYKYDINEGSSFTISTGFNNEADSRDALMFEINDVDGNAILDPIITKDESVDIDIAPMYNTGSITLTPIKYLDENNNDTNISPLKKAYYQEEVVGDKDELDYITFEPVTIPFNFDSIFPESLVEITDETFFFQGMYFDETFDGNFILETKVRYKDETKSDYINSIESEGIVFENSFGYSNSIQGSDSGPVSESDRVTREDVKDIEITIYHENDKGDKIGLFKYYKELSTDEVSFGKINYKEYVEIPYEFILPDAKEFISCDVYFENQSLNEMSLETQTGNLILDSLLSPKVNGNMYFSYIDKRGVQVRNNLPINLTVLSTKLFNEVLFSPSDNTFDFSFNYEGTLDGTSYDIKINTLDSSGNILSSYDDSYNAEESVYSINKEIDNNAKMVAITILYNEDEIVTYNFELDTISASSDVTNLEIDEDGRVSIPYSVKEIEGYTLQKLVLNCENGTTEEIEAEGYEGLLTIDELNANLINGVIVAKYANNNTTDLISIAYNININLNAEINLDYFVPYAGSNHVLAIKYEVLVNNEVVNMNLGLTALKYDYATSSYDAIPVEELANYEGTLLSYEYYSVPLIANEGEYYYSNQFGITAVGFDDSKYEDITTKKISVEEDYIYSIEDYSNFGVNTMVEYTIIEKDENTLLYLIDTGFEEKSEIINHIQRFTFAYTEDGKTKTIIKYLEDNSLTKCSFELPKRDYEFRYDVDLEYEGIVYNPESTMGYTVTNLSPDLGVMKTTESRDPKSTITVSNNTYYLVSTLDLKYIDLSKEIKFLLNDTELSVPYYEKNTTEVEIITEQNNEDGYSYTIGDDDIQIEVQITSDRYMTVAIGLLTQTFDPSKDVLKVNYQYSTSKYFAEVETDYGITLDSLKYDTNYEESLFSYNCEFGEFVLTEQSDRKYIITSTFTNKDYSDWLEVVIKDDNNTEVYSNVFSFGNAILSGEFEVPYYLSNANIYLRYYKEYNEVKYPIKEEYYTTLELSPVVYDNLELIDNGSNNYTFKGNLPDASVENIIVVYYSSTGVYLNYESISVTVNQNDDNSFEIAFTAPEDAYYARIGIDDFEFNVLLNVIYEVDTSDNVKFKIRDEDSINNSNGNLEYDEYSQSYDLNVVDSTNGEVATRSIDSDYNYVFATGNYIVSLDINLDGYTHLTYRKEIIAS